MNLMQGDCLERMKEIEEILEDIDMDEAVLNSEFASGFHRQRLSENKDRLQELLELKITLGE